MDAKAIMEMANDPVMGKVFRDTIEYLQASGAKLGAERNGSDNGNTGSTGATADNERLREITQDRPNPSMPVYTLATPTPVNAAEQSTIRDSGGVDLSWHHDLKKTASPVAEAQKDMTKERGQGQPEQTQQKQPEQTRDQQSRGR